VNEPGGALEFMNGEKQSPHLAEIFPARTEWYVRAGCFFFYPTAKHIMNSKTNRKWMNKKRVRS